MHFLELDGSPSKRPAASLRKGGAMPGGNGSPAGKGGTKDNNGSTFIPFAQRQAKSQVAAHEILKKGKQVYSFIVQ
jgi:hypothetical protein